MNKPTSKNSLLNSFLFAFEGFFSLFKERNFRIHFTIAMLVIILGFIFQIDKGEWFTVLILFGLVMSLEAVNTCIEGICDIISPEFDKHIKRIKDIAAASVLIAAIVSAIIGLMIFLPYVMTQ